MKSFFKTHMGAVIAQNRIICRLFASWLLLGAYLTVTNNGYHDIAFLQEDYTIPMLLLRMVLIFAGLSLLALSGGRSVHTDSLALLVAATVGAVRWTVEFSGYGGTALVTLAVLCVYAMILYWVYLKNRHLLDMLRPGRYMALAIGLCAGAIACGLLITVSVLRYTTFSAPNFDFGIFCNMFHNMKETGLPLVTCERDQLLSHFAVHISPVYYLILPFYMIFPSPVTLQVAQAVVLMLGVIPVYLLSRHFGYSNKMTALLCTLYAFYPPITTGCFYDIHENCFLPLFLLWMFYFFEKRRYIPMYLAALMVLTVKEDAALYLLIFGLYLILSRRNRLHGAVLSAASVGYFVLAVYLLQTQGNGTLAGAHFDSLMYDPEAGLMGVVKTALLNPGFLLTQLFKGGDPDAWSKVWFALQIFLPLGLLPFTTKKPSRWLLLSPILINLLTNYPYQHDTGFHYQFGVCALAFYALLLNCKELKAPARRPLLSLAVSATLCIYLIGGFYSFSANLNHYTEKKDDFEKMEEILRTVPEDAGVIASTFLVPHLAQRSEIYEVDYHNRKTDMEYVVLDLREGYSSDQNSGYLRYYLSRGYEAVVHEEGLVVVLKQIPDYTPVEPED